LHKNNIQEIVYFEQGLITRFFLFATASRPALGPTQPPI